jgi:hypothetical protein
VPSSGTNSKVSHNLPAAAAAVAIESSSSTASPPAPLPQPPPTTRATPLPSPPTTASPPWLNRWLHLWDQNSGTHEILQLKENVNISSTEFDTKQRQVAQARASLDMAMESFEHSQLEHTRLLRSRDTWTSTQAYDFAKLLEKEIDIRKELENAKKALANLEAEQLTSMHSYMNHLRRRYHEEQLWQDKWRVYSTYGTWILIVLNSLVFLISQYMTRLRESQRMKDVQELVYQSIMANEGTLRAIQEQQTISIHDRRQKTNGKEERPRKEGNAVPSEEVGNRDAKAEHVNVITTISKNEAAALVADEGDKHEESNINPPETVPTTPISSKLRNLWSSTCKYASGIVTPRKIDPESTTASNKLVVATTPLSSQIQQYWSNLSKYVSGGIQIPRKITLSPGGDDGKTNSVEVDVPSAILGASVAGIAWLLVNLVAPSRR